MPFLDERALNAAAAVARVVECFYDNPAGRIVDQIHAADALAAWQVGSLEEAVAAVGVGCDFVVVQGHEAGGHVRGNRPMHDLLREVREAVDIPIVAGGGIGTGSAVAAALLAGADAVRVGTRFVATLEASTHPDYAQALIRSTGADTMLTETFTLGWARAPHRVLRACVDASDDDPSTRSPAPPTRDFVGSVATAALYAGESVAAVTAIEPAAAVIRELVRDANDVLRSRQS